MTLIQQHKRILVLVLESELKKYGYKCRRSHSEYKKEVSPFYYIVGISHVVHPGIDFDAMLYLCLGHTELEKLVGEYTRDEADANLDYCSVGGELGNIGHAMGDPQFFGNRRWTIANEGDIADVVSSMMDALHHVAFPFFDRFSSLTEIMNACSKDAAPERTYTFGDKVRAMTAIGAAYLLQDRAAFDSLVDSKTHYLYHESHQLVNIDPAPFVKMAEALTKRWPWT